MTGNEEARARRSEVLAELLQSEGWRRIVAPVLTARLAELERRAMLAQTLDEVRTYQGAWKALGDLLREPAHFLAEREP